MLRNNEETINVQLEGKEVSWKMDTGHSYLQGDLHNNWKTQFGPPREKVVWSIRPTIACARTVQRNVVLQRQGK